MSNITINPEEDLIAKLLATKDFVTVSDKQLDHKFFNGSYRRMFNYIVNHQTKYGKVPDVETFVDRFPDFEPYEPPEPMDYYCDEVREKRKHNTMAEKITEVVDHLREFETPEAYDKVVMLVSAIEQDVILSDRQAANQNTLERLERYKQRVLSGGISGILGGIPSLDRITRGYGKGELTAIIGYTGTGKTWALLIQAHHMAKEGHRVLITTTEMSVQKMMDRLDAIGAGIGYGRFMSGTLTLEEEQRYLAYLEEKEGDENYVVIVEQATAGVAQISAKIDQHKPDVLFIDGAYLLENDAAQNGNKDADDWSSVLRVYRDLHKLCLRKDLPIITTTQSKEREASIGNMSFARAISNELDVLIGLEQDDEMVYDKEMRWKFLKLRDGEITTRGIMTAWDWREMRYGEIYTEDLRGDAVDAAPSEGTKKSATFSRGKK